jgi:hypothetical protein
MANARIALARSVREGIASRCSAVEASGRVLSLLHFGNAIFYSIVRGKPLNFVPLGNGTIHG